MILHLCTTFSRNVPSVNSLIEKAKDTVLSGGEGILGGRNAITQAAPCQSANPEIGKCVCWWHLICLCLLCLGSIDYLVFIEVGHVTNLIFSFALYKLLVKNQKVLKGI